MIKGSHYQEDITILNVCALNNRAAVGQSNADKNGRKTRQIH